MADDDSDSLPPAEAWGEFRHPVWACLLAERRQCVAESMGAIEQAIDDDRRPTAAQVGAAREALDRARGLVERHYAALAHDVEPWDGGVGRNVPYGVLREQLERADYTVLGPGRDA